MEEKVYKKRWLLYVDILGWREHVAAGASSRLLEILKRIHVIAEEHNERVRQEYIARDDQHEDWGEGIRGTVSVNPLYLQYRFGAFSDHFVFSMPDSYGPWFLQSASKLVIDLLHAGFLTRGAAVLGDLYHRDNMIVGPAVVEAADMEARETIYPRILLSAAVTQAWDDTESMRGSTLVIEDMLGRRIVNPFSLPFVGSEAVMDSFVDLDLNLHLREIRAAIDMQISTLEAANR